MDRFAPLLWTLLILVMIAATVSLWVNRPRRLNVEAPVPSDFPIAGFSHDAFAGLLRTYVSQDGRVDYQRWHDAPESVATLDAYLAAINAFSPDTTPDRFGTRDDELAYWMYGYNAWVIKGVLINWPLDSVTDVKAPLEVIKGMGFFYQLRFPFGGKYMSLFTVENDKIRKGFQDPRIHFVLNCASESCPVARPELPTGSELQRLLDRAAMEFINNNQNVRVDHESRTVVLSTIFKWYKGDFVNHMVALGRPAERGLLDYLETVAVEPLLNDLRQATDYSIEFRDYDWRLNGMD
ncbi:MAG: DUF547 domain-containing protein [Gammaproteobacteria bacterium]|nr:DUF547 domain-containing protein [Gammaproteobacteria bacterium]